MPDKIADVREELRRAFQNPREFNTSPLYRTLSRTVAAEEQLLDLASRRRPGQYPSFLFFGAVHYLLLGGADHRLAEFFPSVAGSGAAPAGAAGPALVSFCEAYERELTDLISSRLVQTNQVQRALALRFGLSEIAKDVPGPVHLVEVGTSAGLNLRFDRYGYRVGDRQYGDPRSPVQLVADRYGTAPVPDLDALPDIAGVLGVDLNPIDVRDADARRWLEALIWPENHDQRVLLAAALEVAAADPPQIRRGDAIDVLPEIARTLQAGEPRVVFHAATRIHVPADRLEAFDAAIASLAETGPLWWLSVEDALVPRADPTHSGVALQLRTPDDTRRAIAAVDGHLRWIEPLPAA
jgi:hypothetical protein